MKGKVLFATDLCWMTCQLRVLLIIWNTIIFYTKSDVSTHRTEFILFLRYLGTFYADKVCTKLDNMQVNEVIF